MSTHETCRYASPQRAFVWVRLQLSNTEHSYCMGVCTTLSQRYMALLCHTLIPGPSNTAVSIQSTTWETRVKLQDLPSQRCTKGGLLALVHPARQEGDTLFVDNLVTVMKPTKSLICFLLSLCAGNSKMPVKN